MVTAAYKAASRPAKSAVAPGIVGSTGVVLVWVFGQFGIVVPAEVGIAMAVTAIWIINRALSKI